MNPLEDPKKTFQEISEKASDAAKRAGEYAQEKALVVKERADATLHRGEDYVRANPIPTVLGALAVGLLLGYLVGRRDREQELGFRERYVDEPLDSVRSAVHEALAPVAKKWSKQLGAARHSAEDLVDASRRSGGHLVDEARRFGSNLKFW